MQFAAQFHCGQTAGCIMVPHGMEVSLSLGDFLLDRVSPPPQKAVETLIFDPRLLWPNGCMVKTQDATWYGCRPRVTRHCVRWLLSSPHIKGHSHPFFRSMSVVAKRLDGLRCHLIWSLASAQATLCSMGTQLTEKKGHNHPTQF